MPSEIQLHASCVCINDVGVLLLGPPGAGKSDLALRLIDCPGYGTGKELLSATLIADDQVMIKRDRGELIASAPALLAGRLEIRGLGIIRVPYRPTAVLGLAARFAAAGDIDRLPDLGKSNFEALGIALPLVLIDPERDSAPARLRAALQTVLKW
jgi:serine kinase of HPr protein (carbohydrate metabolism regulator)